MPKGKSIIVAVKTAKAPKAREESKDIITHQRAPAAFGTQVRFTKPQWSHGREPGSLIITHREYVSDVISLGSNWSVDLNHSLLPTSSAMFPYLSQLATLFQQCRFASLQVEYAPSCPTSQIGSVGVAYQVNPKPLEAPANKRDFLMLNGSVVASAWQPLVVKIDLAKRTLINRTESAYMDDPFSSIGDLMVSTEGVNSGTNVGMLFVSYRVELMKPTFHQVFAVERQLKSRTITGQGVNPTQYGIFGQTGRTFARYPESQLGSSIGDPDQTAPFITNEAGGQWGTIRFPSPGIFRFDWAADFSNTAWFTYSALTTYVIAAGIGIVYVPSTVSSAVTTFSRQVASFFITVSSAALANLASVAASFYIRDPGDTSGTNSVAFSITPSIMNTLTVAAFEKTLGTTYQINQGGKLCDMKGNRVLDDTHQADYDFLRSNLIKQGPPTSSNSSAASDCETKSQSSLSSAGYEVLSPVSLVRSPASSSSSACSNNNNNSEPDLSRSAASHRAGGWFSSPSA